jgi:hypothetical protein
MMLFKISCNDFLLVSEALTLHPLPSLKDLEDNPVDNPHFALIEAICISWFTIEYFLRLAG